MNVLVVESNAKAKTLQKYLGEGWRVVATGGHIETLPDDRKRHGKDAGKAYWANRPGELPSPPWVWTERGEEAVRGILEVAGEEPVFWLATDPDREGEFIAWRLEERLSGHGPTRRVAFDEVTREAVEAAIESPRDVDRHLVDSALVRKFLDRLIGYRGAKIAKSVVSARGASLGRVQTPTLGFVVERELEREAHVPIPYFEVRARAAGVDLSVRFHEPDDPDVWRNEVDKPFPSRTFDGELARGAFAALESAGGVRVTGAKEGTRQRRPDAPMSTDVLLQAAGSRFGWSPRKTSALASMLYEAGHITYIRTDSTRLAASAVKKAREVVAGTYGEDHLGTAARAAATTGPVQDAHEAIRPTRLEVEDPDVDDNDARRLYRLIRGHTLASQMAPSQRTVVSIEAACDGLDRPLTGSVSWRTFDGWEAAMSEFMGDVATSPPDVALEEGAEWALDPADDESPNPVLIEDETKPPSRYRPHTLIRAMKEAGIGRPSTYSSTVEKLEDRQYVEQEDGALVPTERGRAIWLQAAPLYAEDDNGRGADDGDAGDDGAPDGIHGGVHLFSPEYTALMEERLDAIERGDVPAPASWEEWRDKIRDLHALAQERKKGGRVLPGQVKTLRRLLENAPAEVRDANPVEEIEGLTYADAQALITSLREQGVKPAATEAQMAYLRQLVEDLELDDDALQELTGHPSIEEIGNAEQASAALEELKRLYDEQRPPSARQRRFIEDLLKETGVGEAEAAAMVGVASLDQLTGGAGGTASALIDALQERAKQ